MSEDNYGRFNFSNGLQRSTQQQQQHQQIRQEKLRVQQAGFEAQLTGMEDDQEEESEGGLNSNNNNPHVYHETAGGMLSEMFNFPPGSAAHHHHLMEHQNYHRAAQTPATNMEWSSSYGGPLLQINNDSKNIHPHHGSSINADSAAAAAMQLFLMNPSSSQHPRSPPSPVTPPLHMLLPNPSSSNSTLIQGFHHPHLDIHNNTVFHQPAPAPQAPPPHEHQFGRSYGDQDQIGGFIDAAAGSQHEGLSLSLSSSLQHLEAAKAEELRMGDAASMLFFNQGHPGVEQSSSTSSHHQHHYPYRNNNHLQQPIVGHQVGYGSSIGVVNVMRNSKYVKAAQELLEEFCSVGRGQFKKSNKFGTRNNNSTTNPNIPGHGGGGGSGGAPSSSKDAPPLSASDRIEHQRRKVKLLSMHDEVDRRYNHYCEQMQMVVNSFDLVMGFGSAVPYTALAQKAMSRHFRCLKDAISAQLKHSYELLGEKDGAGSSGVTKGETPRLRMLEQSLRQQRAFHQMGMMEQEAWRPQRGLPERSVGILRAWLFEHFLHPYPNDADKHLLARQTGLSRNQVSNWFINARVRLWKPMVEEMYVQESKEDEDNEDEDNNNNSNNMDEKIQIQIQSQSQSSQSGHTQNITAAAVAENDLSSLITMNRHSNNISAENHAKLVGSTHDHHHYHSINNNTTAAAADRYGTTSSAAANIGNGPTQLISRGDVSLTLGLRHSGNITPDHDSFFGL